MNAQPGWLGTMPFPLLLLGLVVYGVARFFTWALDSLTRPRRAEQLSTPHAAGLPFEEVWFPALDGVALHGWWIPAPAPAARGTIMLLHGFAGSKDPDLAYARLLHPHFHLLMFDFRAHGRSGGDYTSLGYLERQDVGGALRWLRRAWGVERVGVLGFSMGGAVALLAAADYPAIAAVVTDGAYAHLQHALASEGRRRGYPPILRDLAAWLLLLLSARRLRYPWRLGQPIERVAHLAPRPLLIIHGGQDDLVPPGDAHLLYARAGEPKQLWVIPEAAHCGSLDCGAEAYRDRLVAFFTAALSPGAGRPEAAD